MQNTYIDVLSLIVYIEENVVFGVELLEVKNFNFENSKNLSFHQNKKAFALALAFLLFILQII